MNEQEQIEIDRAMWSAEFDEKRAIIKEAEAQPDFAHYFLGYMGMSDELIDAAKTFLEWKKTL